MCNKNYDVICPTCNFKIEDDEQLKGSIFYVVPICEVCIEDMITGYTDNINEEEE